MGGRRRAVPRQLLSRDGGAGGSKPVRARHRNAERCPVWRCPCSAGRRAREGRCTARKPRVAQGDCFRQDGDARSEEHTSELQSLMRISYAVFCLKKKNNTKINIHTQ